MSKTQKESSSQEWNPKSNWHIDLSMEPSDDRWLFLFILAMGLLAGTICLPIAYLEHREKMRALEVIPTIKDPETQRKLVHEYLGDGLPEHRKD